MNTEYRKSLPGTDLDYFDTREAVEAIKPGAYAKLPYTSRVLAEQLVRRCNPDALTDSLKQIIDTKRDLDFPWYPARVVCHDILGQTALVDLAGLRDAIADQGGDPAKVNPVVPTQLIVDHSLAVEAPGFDPDAFDKNRAIEDRRNEDRFHFIEWCKTAFDNVDVIPAGNGIMHQINLEKMSPVIQSRDGVAFPDTCVGTDSHTPHIDSLGVIAIGVGGLEAETVMLGRPTMMRLPEIIGVKLTGKRQPGITATDIVLALTEFLRNQKVVSAYLEFFGDGARSLTIGDRATISNMTPEFGASAGLFYIDEQTIDYLKLTGRDAEQVALVENYAKTTGLWADDLADAQYERVLEFDLSSVGRNMAGPSNPHRRLPTSALAERGIAGNLDAAKAEEAEGKMPDGAVIIAAITSCTNTSNPRNVVAAGLVARKANAAGPDPQALGEVLLRARLQGRPAVPGRGRSAARTGKARLRHRRLCLHHLQRHERRAGPEDPAGDHRPRPLCHRGAVRQPQLRRPHPPLRQAGLPGLAAAGGGLRHRRHHPLRHRAGRAGHRRRRQAHHPQGHLALGRGDRRHRRRPASSRSSSSRSTTPCSTWASGRRPRARSTTGARRPPTSAVRPIGKATTGRRARAQGHAPARGARRQHHHRSSVAVERHPRHQRRR